MSDIQLNSLFKELKLKAFQDHFDALVRKHPQEPKEILLQLCHLEIERKYDQKIKRKIKSATFPKLKTIAMLDFKIAPKLPKKIVLNLATSEFVKQHQNVLLVGDSGGGKTHLAIALGIQACKQNFSVKFYTASSLANTLLLHQKDGDIEKFLKKLKRYDLLIVDELGFLTLPRKATELLFRVFSDRYETGSTVVTSNLNFSKWTEVFIDKTLTTALLDRLTHNASIIKYDWGSIRFNEALGGLKKRQYFCLLACAFFDAL